MGFKKYQRSDGPPETELETNQIISEHLKKTGSSKVSDLDDEEKNELRDSLDTKDNQ